MELIILDKNFDELGRVDEFSSLQWFIKYYDIGSFELHCTIDYFPMLDLGTYIFRPNYINPNGYQGNNLAFIQSLQQSKLDDGSDELVVTGNFIEDIFNDRIIPLEKNYSGTAEEIAYTLIKEYFIDFEPYPRLKLADSVKLSTEQKSVKYKGKTIADVIYPLLKEEEMSCGIIYDYLTDQLTFKVWKGLDRTDFQSVNDFAIFSDDFETAKQLNYERDISKYRNYAVVVGVDDVRVDVDLRQNGEIIRQVYVRSSLSKNTNEGSTLSDSEYRKKLEQVGREKLDELKQIEMFDCDAETSNSALIYKQDYDIGDYCTCKSKRLDKMADKRITQIKEIYEDGEIQIIPTFGEDYLPLKYAIRGNTE